MHLSGQHPGQYSGFKAVSLALASLILASTAITATAQAQSGSYHPRGYERPRVNEPGPQCRTKLVRTCTTYRGRTYCKPTWQRVCVQPQPH